MDIEDADFLGTVEFDLSPDQEAVVSSAIDRAAKTEDEFARMNPLIVIVQWWNRRERVAVALSGTPEEKLTEMCRLYLQQAQD